MNAQLPQQQIVLSLSSARLDFQNEKKKKISIYINSERKFRAFICILFVLIMVTAHRASVKKGHKAFKSRHASKGELKARIKGKVEKSGGSNKRPHVMSKTERKNMAKQIRDTKAIASLQNRKFFEGRNGVEKIVSIIPLSPDCEPVEVVSALNKAFDIDVPVPSCGSVSVSIERFHQKLRYLIPRRNLIEMLDSARIADYVVFVLSAKQDVDSFGETCIKSILAQGVSNSISVCYNLTAYNNHKTQEDVRQSLTSYMDQFFPDTEKVYGPEINSEALNVVRQICDKTPKGIRWRESRPYLLADRAVELDSNLISVQGYLRGAPLDIDRLIHVPGFGDYQIEKVEIQRSVDAVLPTEEQDGLDELAADDDDEMGDMDIPQEQQMGVRLDGHHYFQDPGLHLAPKVDESALKKPAKLPAGTSAYQASWIIGEDGEAGDEDENEDELDAGMDVQEMEEDFIDDRIESNEYEPSEYGYTEMADDDVHEDISPEDEAAHLKEYRQRIRDDLEFPDEVELDPRVPAKDRLSRYRGVKSLRSAVWDAEERDPRRPLEWNRLLKIHNFKATKNRVLNESSAKGGIPAGSYVNIILRAPHIIASSFNEGRMLCLFGLLRHEHQMSVMNFSITPDSELDESIASKESLIMQVGPRRLQINPLFSQAGNGASNNVYRYERFLHPGRSATATLVAPVVLGNAPVVYFKQNEDNEIKLVGSGTVLDANRKRILVKRVVITGQPFKIHKRIVTIRYMFFNPEDVLWFKAVPLFTEQGRTGYIKESLGTHGYFKATFDGKIGSQDTVGMALYKRLWPRMATMWIE